MINLVNKNLKSAYEPSENYVPNWGIIIIDEQTIKQTKVAFITIGLLIVFTVFSMIILKKKKDILKSRSGEIIKILFICHISNLIIPNVVTILVYFARSVLYVCVPKYLYLTSSHGLQLAILMLILAKAMYMKLKSMNFDITNMNGFFLSGIFLILSIFLFFSLCFMPFMTRTSYRYINTCTLDKIDYQSINFNIFYNSLFLYITFLLMSKIRIWGVREEVFTLLVLTLVYCSLKGWHHIVLPRCHFREELLENFFRLGYFLINCFLFIWLFDDSKKIFTSVKSTDLLSVKSWNRDFLRQFKKFLLFQLKIDFHEFFVNEIEAKKNEWEDFRELLGNRLIHSSQAI